MPSRRVHGCRQDLEFQDMYNGQVENLTRHLEQIKPKDKLFDESAYEGDYDHSVYNGGQDVDREDKCDPCFFYFYFNVKLNVIHPFMINVRWKDCLMV